MILNTILNKIQIKAILLFNFLFFGSLICVGQQVFFNRAFAPSEGIVKPQERPYRDEICLNGFWQFMPVYDGAALNKENLKNPIIPANPVWETTPIKIPSPWNINSFASGGGGDFNTYPEYPAQWENAKAGWLKCEIPYRKEWKGKRLILRFEAVSGYSQIYINKKKVGENFDLFLPFEIDITEEIKENSATELLVWVADAKLFNETSKVLRNARRIHVGGSFWGEHIIGIWQDVTLLAKPAVHIQDIFIKPQLNRDELEVEAIVVNKTNKKLKLTLSGNVMPWINKTPINKTRINKIDQNPVLAPEIEWELGNPVLSLPAMVFEVEPQTSQTVHLKTPVTGKLKTWTAENPDLNGLVLSLSDKQKPVDKSFKRFGWRQFSIQGKEFLLNGKPIVLKGDSWHFMGVPQMTRRYAWAWYEMLKGCQGNAVRLHAQPYPEFYLDMADEMGIFILDETGMWASDGGPNAASEDYWKNSEDHLKRLILRDRNHPSVLGWSVCNENIAVVKYVQQAPESIVQRQIQEINKWVSICKDLDPTRDWISGDGENNGKTELPVVLGHYGHENEMKNWSNEYPIWGIGEQGMAYAATPIEASKFSGNRAYESSLGRMEGVAAEAVELLNIQKKYKANYMSVFNVAWYGLKPLELGLRDTTRAPKMTDGIFFKAYQTGKPGMQPGRLGPYTTTLNPGYDPTLPMFKTWALYDVVKASFSSDGSVTSTWGKTEEIPFANVIQPASSVLVLSNNPQSILFSICNKLGIELQTEISSGGNNLLIIDGKYPPSDQKSIEIQKEVLQKGGQVFIWGVSPASLNTLNNLIPYPVELIDREASSFVIKDNSTILQRLGNADFYFSELTKENIMSYGLTGELVKQGKVLLEACKTDWRKWNHRPEYSKTGSLIRSERESKPEGIALVECKSLQGKLYLLTLDPEQVSPLSNIVLRRLLLNLGANFTKNSAQDVSALNESGKLQNALILGSFDTSGKTLQEAANVDFLKGSHRDSYRPGNEMSSRFWEVKQAKNGILDFSGMELQGPQQQAVAYVSFWLYSPRSLTNLLEEPDMPQLSMYLGVDDAFQVYLNQQLIKDYIRDGSLKLRDQQIEKLPLERGWNHILIKVLQGTGSWQLAVEFDCDKKVFLKELKSQVSK